MVHLLVVILTVIFISIPSFAQPDTLWTKHYGGPAGDFGYSIQQTADGGYIITGSANGGVEAPDVYLIKTDPDGDETWSRSYSQCLISEGHSVQQTTDGGYIITGCTGVPMYEFDVYLIKTDAVGDTIWTRTFGSSGQVLETGNSVQQTADGGYIIGGTVNTPGAGGDYILLIKTDANGNAVWSQTYGGNGDEHGEFVRQTTDGGYIITGYTVFYGAGNRDVYLIKTDANGNELWFRTYGGNDSDQGYCVLQTNDNGYIIAGTTQSYGSGIWDIYLIKTDSNGNEVWSRNYGRTEDSGEHGRFVQQTLDGGYIIVGVTSFSTMGYNVYLIRTDANGNTLWTQNYGGEYDDWGECIQQTTDGGYIIAGYAATLGAEAEVYLIRLDSEFQLNAITITLTPFNPPIQIPANGGSFDFNIEVVNVGTHSATFDIWTMVTLPNGTEYGPIIYIPDFTAPANWSGDRDKIQNIPVNAPSGNYTYDAYIGIYPGLIWNEDNFDFEKLAAANEDACVTGWNCWGDDFTSLDETDRFINSKFSVLKCRPNPFNPSTELTYSLQSAGEVSLAIFDISGRKISTLIKAYQSAGSHKITWIAEEFPSGIYFVRLSTEAGQMQTQKLVLMK